MGRGDFMCSLTYFLEMHPERLRGKKNPNSQIKLTEWPVLYNLPFSLSIWFSLFSFSSVTNLTSLCSPAEQNAHCYTQKHPLIPHSFYDKAVPPHVHVGLWPYTFTQVNMPDGREKWWVKNNSLGAKSHEILLHKPDLKATISRNDLEQVHI